MIRPAASLSLAAALLASACEPAREPEPAPGESSASSVPSEASRPPRAGDFPELQSRDCAEVARFYTDAIAARDFDRAALAWSEPAADGGRLQSIFAGHSSPRIALGEPMVEGAAGSLYCTVSASLTDAGDPAKPPVGGELVLRRVNDVPGATPDQLRWTLRSSTLVESIGS